MRCKPASNVSVRLFYGKIRQRITSVDAQQSRSSIHEKEDLFSHLPVNVANDGIDIYDGLSGYFDDVVEFQGRKARMEVTLVDLPPILQIQLQVCPFLSLVALYFSQLAYNNREYNSTAKLFNPTNLRPMSSLAKISTWIGSWITRVQSRRLNRKPYNLS
jgi:hypothetical protein